MLIEVNSFNYFEEEVGLTGYYPAWWNTNNIIYLIIERPQLKDSRGEPKLGEYSVFATDKDGNFDTGIMIDKESFEKLKKHYDFEP